MKRFFSIILAFFCSQFILGAVSYKKTDVKPGDYVIWDAQHGIYKAIDGGYRGASHRIKPNHWALECDKICPLNGVTSTWMVPTKNEIMSMSWDEKPINSSLKRLRLAGRKDCQEIKTGERYWTIQESSKTCAYSWYLDEHDVLNVDSFLTKSKERYVRTIAAL